MEVYEVRVFKNRVEWYQNGKLHRLDGPAVENSSGYKVWYQNGVCHRLDGPAREWADGTVEYWIEDKLLTEEEFLSRSKPCKGKKVIVDGIEYTLS